MIQRNLQNRNRQTLKTNLWLHNNNKTKNSFFKKENKFMVIKEETL